MSFADWTRTVPESKTAATPATPATDQGENAAIVATVATVADTGKAEKDASIPDLTITALPEVFEFSPPDDPANDDEALQERAAIMAEGCGMDQVQALLEARWRAHREQCWRVFLLNVRRILEAPAQRRNNMLAEYQAEAARRYGQAAARDMAGTMRNWIAGKGVH